MIAPAKMVEIQSAIGSLIETWKQLRDCDRFVMMNDGLAWSEVKDEVEKSIKAALARKDIREPFFAAARAEITLLDDLLEGADEPAEEAKSIEEPKPA